MVNPRSVIIATAIASLPAPATSQAPAIRSSDGGAVLTPGAPIPVGTVRVTQLPDGDDVAGVTGTHYQVDGTATGIPAGSTLAIHWDSVGLPGGASGESVRLMRRLANGWETVAARRSNGGMLVGTITAPGEFAIRWVADRACSGPEFHALDFRLGRWDYRAPGYTPGTSVFTRDPSGCALVDRYVDQQGGRSTSLFLFDPATRRWFNTTIDPGGRFVSSGVATENGIAFYHSATDRESYLRRPDGTVSFMAERSSDGGKSWKAWATATYTRIP